MPLPDLKPGVYPVTLTPFSQDGKEVDYACLGKLVEWYVRSGVDGLFTVAQTSEMYDLTPQERLDVCAFIKDKASGRVPVMASATFHRDITASAEFVNKMSKHADVVVVLASMMAEKEESDDVWMQNVQKLMDLTPGVALGLYEVPVPYHRVLKEDTLRWVANTGRFVFHKDTSRDCDIIAAKLKACEGASDSFCFFNGNCATLLSSLQNGGKGFSGCSANHYPWIHAWLVRNFKTHPELASHVQNTLGVAENIIRDKFPASAKLYLQQEHGLDINTTCRKATPTFTHEEQLKLTQLRALMDKLSDDIGVKPVRAGDIEV